MHNTVFWIYIVLLLVGGLIGYFRGKSPVSLYMSVGFAVALMLTTLSRVFQPGFAQGVRNLLLAALLVVFAIRLVKTRKFMPAGLMLALTVAALALLNLRF
jgi:uncharacterized membrane protein (UPF0136 family)